MIRCGEQQGYDVAASCPNTKMVLGGYSPRCRRGRVLHRRRGTCQVEIYEESLQVMRSHGDAGNKS